MGGGGKEAVSSCSWVHLLALRLLLTIQFVEKVPNFLCRDRGGWVLLCPLLEERLERISDLVEPASELDSFSMVNTTSFEGVIEFLWGEGKKTRTVKGGEGGMGSTAHLLHVDLRLVAELVDRPRPFLLPLGFRIPMAKETWNTARSTLGTDRAISASRIGGTHSGLARPNPLRHRPMIQ